MSDRRPVVITPAMPPLPKKRTITKDQRKPGRSKWPPDPDRVAAILKGLKALYGEATCELDHTTPFQLLIATILSAQCTDERVNKVTPTLFAAFPTAETMAEAPLPVLEDMVRTTGFFRNKAKNIKTAAETLVRDFAGDPPQTADELIRLPGVARKTANVVLGTAFGIASGVVVDTHVQRLTLRLALARHTAPEKIEQDLIQILPQSEWIGFSHRLIWHGRRMCTARKPDCENCPLAPHCPGAFKE